MEPLVPLVRKATQVLMVNLEMMAILDHMVLQEDQEGVSIDQGRQVHLVKMETLAKMYSKSQNQLSKYIQLLSPTGILWSSWIPRLTWIQGRESQSQYNKRLSHVQLIYIGKMLQICTIW